MKTKSRKNKENTFAISTVNTEIKAIKRFFNRAVELEYISRSPARKIKLLRMINKHPRFFTEREVALILTDESDEWTRDAYMMLLYTGMRIGELVNLEWEDIDFERRKILIRPKEFWKPKGMEERIIPMHRVLFQLLINKKRISRWALTKQDGE